MPATATYGLTGDPNLDGILSGRKWAVDALSFSFPSDPAFYGAGYGSGEPTNGFQAFNAAQQSAVRSLLGSYAKLLNLGFAEVTESATVHGDLRYAETNAVSTAWAYYPSTAATGGDSWYNSAKGYYDSPVKGNYAWLTMLHETGHALGLKHPHTASGVFGTVPIEHDSLEYTVMSYRSYVGASTASGYTNGSSSYPQTPMMYDIAALQKLYGADYTTNAGNTVYKWTPASGETVIDGVGQGAPAGNKIFMTIWDGGGVDTYDFSGYAVSLSVNLAPGAWSVLATAQLASLGSGKLAAGNIANALLFEGNPASLIENAHGGAVADLLLGNAADNLLLGGGGNDLLDGAGGTNTAAYSGLAADYGWALNGDGSWTIVDTRSGSPDGTDTLKNIQFLKFVDAVLALGTTSSEPPPPPPPPANAAPVALGDAYATGKGVKLTVAASGVLGNDSDPDGDALSAILVAKPSRGGLTLNADGSFTYNPAKNFIGTVSFSYKAQDGEADSNVATVTIAVGTAAVARGLGGPFGGDGFFAGRGGAIDPDLHNLPAPAGPAADRPGWAPGLTLLGAWDWGHDSGSPWGWHG